MEYHVAYIGLGSNLRQPERQIRAACGEIAALPNVTWRRCSSLYRTAPIGYGKQPDFVNAVAEIRTALTAPRLLAALRSIEQDHGRIREQRNGPRTLDLDILIFGDMQLASRDLALPHPRAHQRAFVLVPLLEIAPDCVIPGRGLAANWLPGCADQSISRIAPVPQAACAPGRREQVA